MYQFSGNIYEHDVDIYNNYWHTARHSIESISRSLEKRLVELEKKSFDIDSIYTEIEKSAVLLSSIYSHSQTIEGFSYLQKIRAHVRDHRSTHKKDRVSLNVVHFILEKLKNLENEYIRKFPLDDGMVRPHTRYKAPVIYAEDYPYKFVSFERNKSFFIAQYSRLEIIPYRVAPFPADSFYGKYEIEYNGTRYGVEDLLASSMEAPPPDPSCYLIVHGTSTRCFASDRIIRRYLSSSDFISSKIKKPRKESSLALGFVTLSGNRHIALKTFC